MKQIISYIFVILFVSLAYEYYVVAQENSKEPKGPPYIIIFRADDNKLHEESLKAGTGSGGGYKTPKEDMKASTPHDELSKESLEMEGNITSYEKSKNELSIQFKDKKQSEKFKVTDDISNRFKKGDNVLVMPSGKKGGYELKEKLK